VIKISKLVDLTGQKFGRLKVLEFSHTDKNYNKYWKVRCDCENKTEFSIRGNSLTSGGFTKSCGCLLKEITSKRNTKKNTYDLTREYGIGYTSKGEEFYFDLEDYDKIKDYCWYIDKIGYVRTNRVNPSLKLHTFILNKIWVDHVNGKPIDNRKFNLREVDELQNAQNAKLRKDNTSGAKGVKWNKNSSLWTSQINYRNTRYHLGYFSNIEEAIKIREIAELYLFAEYSRRYDELINKYNNIDIEVFVSRYIAKIFKLK